MMIDKTQFDTYNERKAFLEESKKAFKEEEKLFKRQALVIGEAVLRHFETEPDSPLSKTLLDFLSETVTGEKESTALRLDELQRAVTPDSPL